MKDFEIAKAVAILRAGGLVAFPTETVYGLGADACNPEAIAKLYAAKGRPAGHPVIVHLAGIELLPQWAEDITPAAQKLAEKFWPGPLTLVLRRAAGVSNALTGGQHTVGLRVPSHPLAHRLLTEFGSGIAAPSANRFGHVSPTTAQHVKQEFGDKVALVIDGGPCDVGIESTIVDVTGVSPRLLRPGRISARQIEEVFGLPLAAAGADAPRAPGTLAAHYAPVTLLEIVESSWLNARADSLIRQGKRVAVLARYTSSQAGAVWLAAPSNAEKYAHDFYANLRLLDAANCAVLLVERLPDTPDWAAVSDRLARAAAGSQRP
jgi:L-threonylcarbamoyladenylate synthase